MAVVTEAVEACLPSPWKPLAARPGRGLGEEVRRAAGRCPQLPPAVRTRRLGKRCCSRCACPRSALRPSTREQRPREPAPPPRFWLPARRRVGFPIEPHLFQEDQTQSYFHHRTGRTQRPWRGVAFAAGVRGRSCRAAIVTRSERSWGLVSRMGAEPEHREGRVHQG